MTRIHIAALGAAMALGACASPDITSRMDNSDTLFAGFADPNNYTPGPIGARADNDFMRFSTMSMPE